MVWHHNKLIQDDILAVDRDFQPTFLCVFSNRKQIDQLIYHPPQVRLFAVLQIVTK
jgi:hypothetical protein